MKVGGGAKPPAPVPTPLIDIMPHCTSLLIIELN